MSRTAVVAGASGFVGSHLVPELLSAGFTVRRGTRDPDRARARAGGGDWVRLDVDDPASLDAALQGADVAYFLVHRMREVEEDDDAEALIAREVAAAQRLSDAAARQGVGHLVYLGGPVPCQGPMSHHLAARVRTGETLRAGEVPCTELRAGMIIGHGSESWLIVRDLAFRLPVMVLPRWLRSRSQPVGIDDVVTALVHAGQHPPEESAAWDLPGPETLSARRILERVAAHRHMRPRAIEVPLLTPSLSSHWIGVFTRADLGLARQLVEGLVTDLVADGPGYWVHLDGQAPTPFDEAVARALDAEPAQSIRGRALERVARLLAARPTLGSRRR